MDNHGFFSHYPFFTPPPQNADDALGMVSGSSDVAKEADQSFTLPPLGIVGYPNRKVD